MLAIRKQYPYGQIGCKDTKIFLNMQIKKGIFRENIQKIKQDGKRASVAEQRGASSAPTRGKETARVASRRCGQWGDVRRTRRRNVPQVAATKRGAGRTVRDGGCEGEVKVQQRRRMQEEGRGGLTPRAEPNGGGESRLSDGAIDEKERKSAIDDGYYERRRLVLAGDASAEGVESIFDILVAAVDLVDMVDTARSFRTHSRNQHGYTDTHILIIPTFSPILVRIIPWIETSDIIRVV